MPIHRHSPNAAPPARLIVNADDFGYFEGVDRGIIAAAERGAITATGVMTNGDGWPERAQALRKFGRLDIGVHLNLTAGWPLTNAAPGLVDPATGAFFESKFHVARALLSRRVTAAQVSAEWDAQIARCREAGLDPVFLNSHEHVHMFPPLFAIIHELARKHGIAWVRRSEPEWRAPRRAADWAREIVLQLLSWTNRRVPAPRLLGVSRSGRLDFAYLQSRLASLRPGRVYELMCHPGMIVAGEKIPARLRAYHDWTGELDALCLAQSRGLFQSPGVELIGFRDLTADSAAPAHS